MAPMPRLVPQHRREGHRAGSRCSLAILRSTPGTSSPSVEVGPVHRRAARGSRGPAGVRSTGAGKVAATASRAAPRVGGDAAAGPARRPAARPSSSPPNRCWQLSRILSNTGCASAIELLMTCSTSAVAVCCSSASLRLVEQAHVLDRDHRLVGEGLQQRDLARRRTAAASRAVTLITPIGSPSRSSGTTSIAAVAARARQLARRGSSASTPVDVVDVHRSRRSRDRRGRSRASARSAARRSAASRRRMRRAVTATDVQLRRRRCADTIAELPRRRAALARSAMASNTGCTSVGELADHLQDLGRRRLPLQRLLGLVEHPRVLDRDHRLVGEGLEQRELLVGERPRRHRRSTAIAPMPRPSQSIGAKTIEKSPPQLAPAPRRPPGTSGVAQRVG